MKVIQADHERRLALAGVPGLVRRPVDIDRAQSGFDRLRSLRVYRFDPGSTIEGHAEEDEVFVVVMAGSIKFTASGDQAEEASRSFQLSAVSTAGGDPCVAYLPPHSAYQLTPRIEAEIAYIRATPPSGAPANVFVSQPASQADMAVLLEEKTYAQLLRLRVVQIDADKADVDFTPMQEAEARCEAFVHIRTAPATGAATLIGAGGGGPIPMESWDSAVVMPGDRPTLRIAKQCSALVLVVFAA